MNGTALLRFSWQARQYYAGCFLPFLNRTGLTMQQAEVLLFLYNNPGMDTARDITEYRGLAKSQISQAVDGLATQGLLSRAVDAGDRRIVRLSITPEGMPVARRARTLQAACIRELMADLSETERDQMERIAEKLFARADALVGKD